MTKPVPEARSSRPPVLDNAKRKQIIALLAHGCSRRVAAKYVGCAASTITRAVIRDPEFGEQVTRAESNCEIDALRHIHAAARDKRHWRAAAWLLERRNPYDFAKRRPDLFTLDAVKQVLTGLAEVALDGMSEEQYLKVRQRMADVLGTEPDDRDEPAETFEPAQPQPIDPTKWLDDEDEDDEDDEEDDKYEDDSSPARDRYLVRPDKHSPESPASPASPNTDNEPPQAIGLLQHTPQKMTPDLRRIVNAINH